MLFSSFDGQLQSHFTSFTFNLHYIDMLSNYPGSKSDHLGCFLNQMSNTKTFVKKLKEIILKKSDLGGG